ncbi:MAG: hypothetical protein ACE5KZ_00040 [Candidatus Scalinduaceae bacterium]
MKRKDTSAQKLGYILIVVMFFIAGSFLTAGCLTTTGTGAAKINDPSIMSMIKEGVTTKEEVRQLLGEPNGVSRNSDGSETWTYTSNDLNSQMLSTLPIYGASHIIGSLVPGAWIPAMAVNSATSLTMPTGATAYQGAVTFNSQGIVTSASSGRWGDKMFKTARTNKSKVVATTKQQPPVYTTKNSRVYHKRNCSELNTEDLIQFSSAQKAREAGGVPCKHCNPS